MTRDERIRAEVAELFGEWHANDEVRAERALLSRHDAVARRARFEWKVTQQIRAMRDAAKAAKSRDALARDAYRRARGA